MIYLDSSVALAELFLEPRRPADDLWSGSLVSSRLLQYEIFNRLHARRDHETIYERAREILARVNLFELSQDVLESSLTPFPLPCRTLDALHLATMIYLRNRGDRLAIASYDARLIAAAQAVGIRAVAL